VVCRSKHVEPSLNFGIINSITSCILLVLLLSRTTMHGSMNIKKEGYNVCVRNISVCGNKNIQSRVCCYCVHSEKFQNCAQCLRHFLPQSSLCSSSCCCHTSKWHVLLLLLDNIRLAKLLFPNHIATNYNLIYSYNKSQRNALFLKFILVQISTCLGQIYSPSSGVLTSLVDSQHNQYNKYLLLCIQY